MGESIRCQADPYERTLFDYPLVWVSVINNSTSVDHQMWSKARREVIDVDCDGWPISDARHELHPRALTTEGELLPLAPSVKAVAFLRNMVASSQEDLHVPFHLQVWLGCRSLIRRFQADPDFSYDEEEPLLPGMMALETREPHVEEPM